MLKSSVSLRANGFTLWAVPAHKILTSVCTFIYTRVQNITNVNRHSVWERPNYHSSPSISRSLDACLEICGLSKDRIDLFDFYSCVTHAYCSRVIHGLILIAAASPSSQS